MGTLQRVSIGAIDPHRFKSVLHPSEYDALLDLLDRGKKALDGRVIWNVNSTAAGGGVAELLRPLLGYARGGGVDARWKVITGSPPFFALTKRLHNQLHGVPDDGDLGDVDHDVYERTLAANAAELVPQIQPQDVVILHDPQTAGLISAIKAAGAIVIWRCHVGIDHPNGPTHAAWRFLSPYVHEADAYVFSRETFAWAGLEPEKTVVITPSIDAFSPKNEALTERQVSSILSRAGIVAYREAPEPSFARFDGTPGRVDRTAEMLEVSELQPDDRVVLQVSRWDRLKDPVGVVECFAKHVFPDHGAHLVLAGPQTAAVSDDPEGAEVLESVKAAWEHLDPEVRARVHLCSLPMEDGEENAAIVNALQRHAEIVVQKSLAEGFGLVVGEAMWKEKPMVATRVGGIQDQIVDGISGILIDDPYDLAAFGAAISGLLDDPDRARRIGQAARARVRDEFLGPTHLGRYFQLIERLITDREQALPLSAASD